VEAGGVGVVTMKAWLRLGLSGWLLVPGVARAEGIFQTEPKDLTVPAGCTALFTAGIDRDYERIRGYTYQWYLGGEAVPGATTRKYGYHTTEVTAEPALYWLVVTNAGQGLLHTSRVATLTVGEPGPCVADFPKIRLGKQNVSLMVKAERFLPLELTRCALALVSGLTNDALASAGTTAVYPSEYLGWGRSNCGKTENMPYEMITNAVWSNTFVFKSCFGVGSCVQGWYSNQDVCVDSQLMNRGVLVTRRHFLTQGHICVPTVGVLGRFIGTNNTIHLARIQQNVCGNWHLGMHPWADYIITNTAPPNTFSMAQFEEDLPEDVQICKVWPTNAWLYLATSDTRFAWLQVRTCQDNFYTVRPGYEMDWPGFFMYSITSRQIDVGSPWAFPSKLSHCYLGTRGGDSGSPYYSILDNEMVGGVASALRWRVPIEATIQYLWTNNGGSIETCPKLTEVDLSRFDMLR
jgi:hypothetical protein